LEKGQVVAGPKGLEAAAREARYAFFETLPGKLATAHTADDNAETVLMHLVRGTGLKGLGGISPKRGRLIRPMLSITRQQVVTFLREYHLEWVEDSSNAGDDFLRNRLRHRVMPILKEENPCLAENVSRMALTLRQDEQALNALVPEDCDVFRLRELPQALRRRALTRILVNSGVPEPEHRHIALAERLVFSHNPSAAGAFPGGVIVGRRYEKLVRLTASKGLEPVELVSGSSVELDGLRVSCQSSEEAVFTYDQFTVKTDGPVILRSRQSGDRICLKGGSVSLKKLFIDRKIPANLRHSIPVLADDRGVLGVYGIGADVERAGSPGLLIRFEKI